MSSNAVSQIGLGTKTKQFLLFAIAWASAIGFVLSVHAWPINLGHDVCGPWGCGPPTLTLVSCHLAWITVLGPPSWWLFRRFSNFKSLIAFTGIAASGLATVSVAAHVHWQWLPSVSEYYQTYRWQRVGFILATAVEYPILPVGFLAVAIPLLQRIPSLQRKSLVRREIAGP